MMTDVPDDSVSICYVQVVMQYNSADLVLIVGKLYELMI